MAKQSLENAAQWAEAIENVRNITVSNPPQSMRRKSNAELTGRDITAEKEWHNLSEVQQHAKLHEQVLDMRSKIEEFLMKGDNEAADLIDEKGLEGLAKRLVPNADYRSGNITRLEVCPRRFDTRWDESAYYKDGGQHDKDSREEEKSSQAITALSMTLNGIEGNDRSIMKINDVKPLAKIAQMPRKERKAALNELWQEMDEKDIAYTDKTIETGQKSVTDFIEKLQNALPKEKAVAR